jgi:hypothetical protein
MRNSERRNSEAALPCGRRDTPKSSAHDGRRARSDAPYQLPPLAFCLTTDISCRYAN